MKRNLVIAVRSVLLLSALASLPVAILGFSRLDPADGMLAGIGVAGLGLSLALLCVVHVAPEQALRLDPLTCLPIREQLLRDLSRAIQMGRGDHPQMLVLIDLIGFKEYNDTFGRPAGDALLLRLGHSLARMAAARGTAYRLDGAEFAALVTVENDAAMLAEFISGALEEDGEGFSISTSYGIAVVPHEAETPEDALRVANERLYALTHTLHAGGRRAQATEEVLMRALDKRCSAHGDWVQGLGELVEAVAQQLELSPEELEQVRIAAALHDVGKSAVPSTILEKRFPLDRDERDFVERHPLVGERILHAAPALTPVAQLVRWTHERYDGGGYPDRLRGSEIPVGARIISVCDAFDAMISKRPYRPAMTPEEAVAELRRCAGSQFDPAVVEAFCAVMEERERFFAAA